MERSEQLTVKQASSNYWVVRSGDDQIGGGVTRQAAEAARGAAAVALSAPRRPAPARARPRPPANRLQPRALQQRRRRDLERAGDLHDRVEADVELAALDRAVVAAIDPRAAGECLLRQASLAAHRARRSAERDVRG